VQVTTATTTTEEYGGDLLLVGRCIKRRGPNVMAKKKYKNLGHTQKERKGHWVILEAKNTLDSDSCQAV